MILPATIADLLLEDHLFRLLTVMAVLSEDDGSLSVPIKVLCEKTGKSRSAINKQLRSLEALGYVITQRSKRGRGFHSYNSYKVNVASTAPSNVSPTLHSNVASTGHLHVTDDQVLLPYSHTIDIPSSYENIKFKKVSEEEMNKKWQEELEADSAVGGVGRLEAPAASQPAIRKNDPKTRGKRPESDWTPADVAAEFSFRVGRKYPWLPGTVNVHKLSGALAKMRKTYQTTALLELELLKMFMENENNFKDVGSEAPHLYKIYLASFRTQMNQARENLGLPNMVASVSTGEEPSKVYASDGREFDNTIVGRKARERYEEKLIAKQH